MRYLVMRSIWDDSVANRAEPQILVKILNMIENREVLDIQKIIDRTYVETETFLEALEQYQEYIPFYYDQERIEVAHLDQEYLKYYIHQISKFQACSLCRFFEDVGSPQYTRCSAKDLLIPTPPQNKEPEFEYKECRSFEYKLSPDLVDRVWDSGQKHYLLNFMHLESFSKFPRPLPAAKTISLIGNRLQDFIAFPVECPQLENLYLTRNRFKSTCTWPGQLTSLKILLLDENELETLEGFPRSFPNLYFLNLAANKLQHLHGFPSDMPLLERLSLAGNGLTSLNGLPNTLPKVESFDLRNNNLEGLEHLPASLPRLKTLRLGQNRLTSFKNFPRECPNLSNLELDHNQIHNFKGFPTSLPLLSDFYSKYNPLNSLHGLTSELMRVWVTTFGLYGYPYEDEDEEGWEGGAPEPQAYDFSEEGLGLIKECADCLDLDPSYPDYELPPVGRIDQDRFSSQFNRALERVYEYYEQDPLEIAKLVVRGLPVDPVMVRRLTHEGGYQELQILQLTLPADHELVLALMDKVKISLHDDYSLWL